MAPYTVIIGLVTLELDLPGVSSLKEKRGIVKSMIARMQKTFNVSVSEVGYQDLWQSTAIAVATVTNSKAHANQTLTTVTQWVEQNYPDYEILSDQIEIL
jgi:uncharacterized protein YlxP (DUF503 family)